VRENLEKRAGTELAVRPGGAHVTVMRSTPNGLKKATKKLGSAA